MRSFGLVLLILGVAAFFYCGAQLDGLAPVPEGLSIRQSLDYPAGRYEVGRYGAAFVGFIGFMALVFPKGR